MPIKYIGRTTTFKGNRLWEIIGNLKDFGVGRIVVRGRHDRYPEKSWFKIVRAEPAMDKENMYGNVWAEKVFRGVKIDGVNNIGKTAYKPDYQLIPKHEESSYCQLSEERKMMRRVLPAQLPLPPLLQEMIALDYKSAGKELEKPMQMKAIYNNRASVQYELTNDDSASVPQKPTHYSYSPHLYQDTQT